MYTKDALSLMIVTLAIMTGITFVVLLKVKISGIKVMLFGIGLILFTDSVLKEGVGGGMEVTLSLLGLSFCLAGLLKRDE